MISIRIQQRTLNLYISEASMVNCSRGYEFERLYKFSYRVVNIVEIASSILFEQKMTNKISVAIYLQRLFECTVKFLFVHWMKLCIELFLILTFTQRVTNKNFIYFLFVIDVKLVTTLCCLCVNRFRDVRIKSYTLYMVCLENRLI